MEVDALYVSGIMSDSMEVLITLPFTDEQVASLEAISPRLKIRIIRTFRIEDIPPEVWATMDVLYTDRLLPTLEQSPNLRWIQLHWAGISHVIDAPILQKADLLVTTLSGAMASKVAEHVVMLLLALGLHLPDLMNSQRRAEWPNDRWDRFKPRELRDSVVGIAGYGSIGRQIAQLLQPFGARVVATKRDAMHPVDNDYMSEGWGDPQGDLAWRLYPGEALRSMVKECDFVVVTLPLTAATRNVFGANVFEAMKPTAYLVDVSRGGVVDHDALSEALKEHKLAGAALDVFPKEPLPSDSPLWKMSNVIVTPHVGGITSQYNDRAVALFAENLRRYLAGQPLYNVYNPSLGY